MAGRSGGSLMRRATFQENISNPVERPIIRTAGEAGISPDELVIGVVVAGKARAYRLTAMEGITQHLVNDVIADVPVSVAYCNLSECARAFVGKPGADPLRLRVSGLLDGAMVLEAGDIFFFQESGNLVDPALFGSSGNPVATAHARRAAEATTSRGPTSNLPFATLKPAIMTWKSWIAEHPGTDSYEGTESRR